MRAVLAAILLCVVGIANARNSPTWSTAPESIRAWFQSLMQPDNPVMSCCGEADAFEADTFESESGDLPAGYDLTGLPIIQHGSHYVAIITDGKGVIPNGTRIRVPDRKLKWDAGNPTGHGIIFLQSGTLNVYCYVVPGGV